MALLNPESSQAIQDSKFLFAQPLVDDQVGKAIREALGFANGFCGRLSAKVWRAQHNLRPCIWRQRREPSAQCRRLPLT
jgi:hypothetical protein